MICEQEAESFKWRCRTDIEDKPGRYVPDCNFLGIINKKISFCVEICYKESENDINGEEAIDNVVEDEKRVLLVGQKSKLKWADPGRVDDQNNQQHFPSPVTGTERRNYVFLKLCCLVDSGPKRWEEMTREDGT